MQPRFDKRTGTAPEAMLNQPRFRAAFDFLRLRAESGEGDKALVEWWESFSMSDERGRQGIIDGLRQSMAKKRNEKAAVRETRSSERAARAAGGEGEGGASRADNKMEILKQLAITTRAALAEDASDEDRAAARAMFEKLGIRAGGGASGQATNQRQELLQEFADLTLAAIAPGAGQTDRAIARGMLEKLDKKANGGGRRRRGGGGRKKPAAAAAANKDDDDGEVGEDFFGT